MLVVVLLPLFIGLTTVLLVKSITEIVWLSVLVLALTLTPTLSVTLTPLERSACSGATHAMHMLSSAAVIGSSRRASRRASASRRPVLWA